MNYYIRPLKQFYVSLTNWISSFVKPNDFNDVLVIRLDQLGDFVLWLDSAKEYKKLYHGRKLTLLVNANWFDFAKSLPYWDEVVPLDTMKFRLNIIYRMKFLFWLRRKGFEIVICPRHSVKMTLEPPIVAVSGAQQKIVCEGSFPIEKQTYFTRSIPMRPNVHELSRNADFVRGLGRTNFKSTTPLLPRYAKENSILICPVSYRKTKNWPIENYIEIIKRLIRKTELKTYVSSNKPINFPMPVFAYDFSGKTNVIQFVELVSRSSLVIANDSAAIHLASAMNIPSICIGAENLGRFLPYEVEKSREDMVLPRLIYKNNVKDITVNEVWDVVKEMIDGHNIIHVGS